MRPLPVPGPRGLWGTALIEAFSEYPFSGVHEVVSFGVVTFKSSKLRLKYTFTKVPYEYFYIHLIYFYFTYGSQNISVRDTRLKVQQNPSSVLTVLKNSSQFITLPPK